MVFNMFKGYERVSSLDLVVCDALSIMVFEDIAPEVMYEDLDRGLNGLLSKLRASGDLTGKEGEVLKLYLPEKPFKRLIIVGGGKTSELTKDRLRVFGGESVVRAKEMNLASLCIALPKVNMSVEDVLYLVAEGAGLANYEWSRKKEVKLVKEIKFVGKEEILKSCEVLDTVAKVVEAVNLGRDLANAPADEINPQTFEEAVFKVFNGLPVKIKVLHKEDLEKLGMNGILSVGRGSNIPPRLIIVEYEGAGPDKPWYAVVGKGVCFDAGGLNLKDSSGMLEMKYDKSGAAYAVALAYAVAKLKLKVNLVVLTPLAENLPSGNAYKPLDIIRMYNGLTVEVRNTDAEGRLILADALSYAEKNYRLASIIDLATLTGAVVVALGSHAAGLFTNNEDLKNSLIKASEETSERVWPLPLWREYYEDIKSDFADIKNIGVGRAAGAIIGAAFLSKFVEKTPWAHLDIAGIAWVQEEGPKKPYLSKGATGFGVRLLLNFLKTASNTA
ncbi:MAG: leucyl aminopeptidase [Zestosphaera tikiterensis]|uniref:Probable cytosol aminopeptidase n=1 Tax=Zestosphaera tikiterensis TaxID=1973259 RepID=A0A2R7Y8X9_9CREN|nr:MAG: leucyl aminopeptidase [Zestosphaera tikiterensis]